MWMDGSRLDTGLTGANVPWSDTERRTWKTYLRRNKEVFDAELYVIGEALEIVLRGGWTEPECGTQHTEPLWTKIHILVDF